MTPLTGHELDVLLTYARVGSIRAAAVELNFHQQTVKNTLLGIHRKLGVKSSIQALWKVIGEEAA